MRSHFDVSACASEQAMRALERTALPGNLGRFISACAERYGDQPVAVFFDDGVTLTYRDLDRRTRRMAQAFSRLGVTHGTHVALMLNTEVAYPIAWLSLARLGATAVPVNYSYTGRELDYVIKDSNAQFLIIDSAYVRVLSDLAVPPLPRQAVVIAGARSSPYLSWEDLEAGAQEDFSPVREPDRNDVVNIQYTSGTTGMPKGAMIPQAYWLLRGEVWRTQLHFPIARNLVAQPFHYVDGQAMFMLAMASGGTAYIARRQSSTRFMNWVRGFRVNFCSLPEIVTNAPETAGDRDNDLAIAYCYSHRLENYKRNEARYGCVIRQGYGMTELGSALYVPVEAAHMTGTGTVGVPSAHREVRIVDENGHPVARGTEGEIHVRGFATFNGYYNRPEANAASVLPGGWLKTGDAGRQDGDGWFYYLGRRKDMIRRSGENISAIEVEGVLRGVPGVIEAAVLPVADDVRGEEIKAYLKLETGMTAEQITPQKVLAYCAQNLARFKVPRYIAYVDEFPRTPGLKIKKSDLIAAASDLRQGAYDGVLGQWHNR